MPKGIGYGEASKMGIFSKKKKKDHETERTTAIEKRLKAAGMSPAEIKRLRDKKKKRG
jgi:DNA-binding transcriptional regulator YiaG